MKVIITGGAGFIGSNAAARQLARGNEVVVLDNLSRRGAERNWSWLQGQHPGAVSGGGLTLARADLRASEAVDAVFAAHADAEVVLHLGGQVAVTTSVVNPREDFEINALGTFNVLEAARRLPRLRALLYASTNKVYGGMEDVGIVEHGGRYAYAALPQGVSETQQLDFHSPYGCSKGAADQYTADYARIYGLPTVTLRQSCIYGPRQLGVEDQGWVAWFTIAAVTGKPVTIYGDGRQVRDLLFVDDLCEAYDAAVERMDRTSGQVFNLGGGPDNTLSLLELVEHLDRLTGRPLRPAFAGWRPGDQPVFVADVTRASEALGWRPRTGVTEGVEKLARWVQENRALFG